MNIKFTIFFLFLTCLTFGQSTRDTVVDYNGRQAKMKMEFDKKGQKTKETVLYDNGNIETEYFYIGNQKVHWITYDIIGAKTAEWKDPKVENLKHKQTRNTALIIVSFLLISFIWWSWKRFGYAKTYFIIGYSTIIFPLITFILENRIEQTRELIIYFLSSVVLVLPVLLLILSATNFYQKTDINIFISILFILVSIGLLLFYTIATMTAGVLS